MISKFALSSVLAASLVLAPVNAIKDPANDTTNSAPLASAHSAASSEAGSESVSESQPHATLPSQADDIRELRASLLRLEAGLKQDRSDNYGLRQFQYWAGSFATVSLVLLVILQAASHIK